MSNPLSELDKISIRMRGQKMTKVAELADLNPQTIGRVLAGKRGATMATIDGINAALDKLNVRRVPDNPPYLGD